jgi:hypothetical protein
MAPQTGGGKAPWRIDDLAAPAPEILCRLPGVAAVEVLVEASRPSQRIIHLRDWHYVPADLFATDVQQASGKPLASQQIAELHREHLQSVEVVQVEQVVFLRSLIKDQGSGACWRKA